jgi:hypothetical protein
MIGRVQEPEIHGVLIWPDTQREHGRLREREE